MFLEKFPYNTKITGDNFPESIPSFIEVSQSSRMKYEWSHKKKLLVYSICQKLLKKV